MPEADPPDTPLHVSAEEWLLRSASREEIAARYDARQRRANRQLENTQPMPLPTVRRPAPKAALMTACDVLTWIAFGEIRELDELIDLGEAYRWGHTGLHHTLAAIEAIIAGTWAADPDDIWAIQRHQGHPAWTQAGRAWIEALRQHIERQDGTAISLPRVGEMLAEHIEEHRQACAHLDLAHHALLETLRYGSLKGYGRRNGQSEHLEMPSTVFMDARIEVTWFDAVRSESPRLPKYADVRFQTTDVLRLWPAQQTEPTAPKTTTNQPAHEKRDLSSDAQLIDRLQTWFAVWSARNPQHSEVETTAAAEAEFPGQHIKRQMIRNLLAAPDGTPKPRGKKPGKSCAEHHRRMRP
jgi:hypothetical protein